VQLLRTHDGSSRAGPSPLLNPVADPRDQTRLAGALAAAFLAGDWNEDALVRRGRQAVSPAPRWIRRVAAAVLAAYHRPPADRPRELAAYVRLTIIGLRLPPPARASRVRRWFVSQEQMGRRRWPVAELETTADLAELLELDAGRLDWLADVRSLERSVASEQLRNYRYAWLPRRGAPPRVIEQPKWMLKSAQRRVLREVLDRVPAHAAAHGFVAGRSARSHAAAHTRAEVVVRLDLEDYFASVTASRVFGIFRTAGYSEGVAHTLTALCTNVVPRVEWAALPRPGEELLAAQWRLGRRLATPHLPQGAPTSPALASLATFSLDGRLSGLASAFGARYTRYADDLAFSGDAGLGRGASRLVALVAEIARDEGFLLNPSKTRVMPRSGRQHLCGVVVNEHPNVTRREYDLLKATLHDAVQNGVDAANRSGHPSFRAHLLGRVAWVEQLNPAKGRRLRERFEAISWPDA
jgi:RNA-directed DNA polymerase